MFLEDISREVIDSEGFADARAILKRRYTTEATAEVFKARFGRLPDDVKCGLRGLVYQPQADAVLRLAATCLTQFEFETEMNRQLRSQWGTELGT